MSKCHSLSLHGVSSGCDWSTKCTLMSVQWKTAKTRGGPPCRDLVDLRFHTTCVLNLFLIFLKNLKKKNQTEYDFKSCHMNVNYTGKS